jgi:hypothetical protein
MENAQPAFVLPGVTERFSATGSFHVDPHRTGYLIDRLSSAETFYSGH